MPCNHSLLLPGCLAILADLFLLPLALPKPIGPSSRLLACRSSGHELSCWATPASAQPAAFNVTGLHLVTSLTVLSAPPQSARFRAELSDLLKSLPALRTLQLRQCGLRNLASLPSAAPEALPSLQTVNLSSNLLTIASVGHLAAQFPSAHRLLLANCSLSALLLRRAVRRRSLAPQWRLLDLSHNALEELSLSALLACRRHGRRISAS